MKRRLFAVLAWFTSKVTWVAWRLMDALLSIDSALYIRSLETWGPEPQYNYPSLPDDADLYVRYDEVDGNYDGYIFNDEYGVYDPLERAGYDMDKDLGVR